jgi:DeoR family transcriptional regulator of aga operon
MQNAAAIRIVSWISRSSAPSARATARLIPHGEPHTLAVRGGTTTTEVIRALRRRAGLTVITNALPLAADGVSAGHGVTTYDETEARTDRTMIAHAHRVIVVADGTKIGEATRAPLADLAEVHDLVTDEHTDPAELRRVRDLGVRVHLA